MTEEARQARNAYYREWAKKNREKRRRSQEEYWERKAAAEELRISKERAARSGSDPTGAEPPEKRDQI